MIWIIYRCFVAFSIVLNQKINAQQITPITAHVLIYSATADFRHDSIPTAIQAMISKGPTYNIQFDNTEDSSWFTDGRISLYDALVFLDNTGQGKSRACVILDPHIYVHSGSPR